MRAACLRLLTAALLALAAVSQAHESRPLLIELNEGSGGSLSVHWRTPPSVQIGNRPDVVVTGCTLASGVSNALAGPVQRRLYRCGSLDNAAVTIHYPVLNPSISTLLRVNRVSGETHSLVASPGQRIIALPQAATAAGVARDYLVLGVEHIWGGYDHLLFVACLVLIAGTPRRMLITITGFTLAHSLTLALAALGLVRVPVPPVEATIALSILFLATELLRERRDTLTWRYPIVVSAAFGLLHGFGFASALGEIGLPQTEVSMALLFFNLGVELGQIAFVLAFIGGFIGIRWLWHRRQASLHRGIEGLHHLQRPTGYVVGCLGAFWLLQRVSGFWA